MQPLRSERFIPYVIENSLPAEGKLTGPFRAQLLKPVVVPDLGLGEAQAMRPVLANLGMKKQKGSAFSLLSAHTPTSSRHMSCSFIV